LEDELQEQKEKGPLGEREGCPDLVWVMKEVQEREKIAKLDSPQASVSEERVKV
jgi:hypothetical protein